MAIRTFEIPGFGNFTYDDAVTPNTKFYSNGIVQVDRPPVDPEDVIRLADSGSAFAPASSTYVVLSLDGTLTQERRLQAGDFLSLVDGGANGDVTLNVDYKDEDDMSSNSSSHVPTQQSVKAYVDNKYTQQSHITDADGTLADITTKFNTLLSYLETLGFLAPS